MTIRTIQLATTLALGVALLGACSDSEPDSAAGTATTTKTVAVTQVNEASVLAGGFAADFRAQYPKLAAGRGDQGLASDAVDTCHELVKGTARRHTVITLVATAFTVDGQAPNDATTVKIINLIVKDACPDRAGFAKTLL
jgi:hypothetical protein